MKTCSFPLTCSVLPQISPTKRHLSPRGNHWRRIMVILGVMGLALLCLAPAWAGDGALDPSFNNLGVGVQKIPIIRGQADYTTIGGVANGSSLIFGYFTSVTDSVTTYSRGSIAKLTDPGTVDIGLNIPVNGEVRGAMLMDPTDPHSKILIWGSFSLTSSARPSII